MLAIAGLRPAGIACERLFAANDAIPRKGNRMDGNDMEKPKVLTEREARICLAALGEASDTDICCFGYEDSWQRALRFNPKAAELTFEKIQAEADEIGLRLVTHGDDEWPTGLDDLKCHSPAVLALWIAGEPLILREAVCITGARAATAYGLQIAEQMAFELANKGHTIVTGLAHGIDAAALKGALAARQEGGPAPVVVLASGIADHTPPRLQSQEDLVKQMLAEGTVLTELPPGTQPSRTRFELRGRILAALSHATVIVEGGTRSSARYVARDARSLQRHVLAVPGPVTSLTSALPHELIQQGRATLVTCAQDVVDHLDAAVITDRQAAPFADPFDAFYVLGPTPADNSEGA